MSLRWYYSVDALTVLEITDRVDWPQIEIGGKANQDSWEGNLTVEDPVSDFIPLMYRRIYAVQDAAPAGGQVVGNWFITNLKIKRGSYKTLDGRTWTITMADENWLLGKRKFVGSDANRPAETDIARLRWALTTTELNQLDPNEDFIDTTNPVALDAADLRTQGPGELMTSLTAASGKQCWVMYREDLTPHVYTLWYANQNTSSLYSSTLSLSNVASEVGVPTSTLVYPLSGDAELDRAGGRMASGLVAPYKTAWIYLQDIDVGDAYAYVDRVAGDFKNVSTLAKASAQVSRELRELSLPDDEITTTVTVEEANLNLIKHGMILPVHATHFPNYTDDTDATVPGYLAPGYAAGYVQCRVMERNIRQVGPTTFELPLRLSPMTPIVSCVFDGSTYGLTTPGYHAPLGGPISVDGYTLYYAAGGIETYLPIPGWSSAHEWNFPIYMVGRSGIQNPGGWVDLLVAAFVNGIRLCVVTDPLNPGGTVTIYVPDSQYGQGPFMWRVFGIDGPAARTLLSTGDHIDGPGTETVNITIPSDSGYCMFNVEIGEPSSGADQGRAWDGWFWTPA